MKLLATLIGVVNAALPATKKDAKGKMRQASVDNKNHEFTSLVPRIAPKDDSIKALLTAVESYIKAATAINAGEAVEVTDDAGAVLVQITPYSTAPTASVEEIAAEVKDGKEVSPATVRHGQAFLKFSELIGGLPTTATALADALNFGIDYAVRQAGNKALANEFGVEGKRGRSAGTFDATKIAK